MGNKTRWAMMVVVLAAVACSSGTASPKPASQAPAGSPAASVAPALPATPTGYTELDQALDGTTFKGKTVSIQTQWIGGEGANFAASVADFAATSGIKIQIDSIGSSHETVLRTRIEGGQPPDLAMLAQPTGVLAYGAGGKAIDVSTFMDAAKLTETHTATIGFDHRRRWPHLGHPLQGRRQVDRLVSDQGIREGRLRSSHDLGRADRSVRPDRCRRQGQPLVHRHRGRYRHRLAGHRLGRGSHARDARRRQVQPVDRHDLTFDSPEVKAAFEKVGKILFTDKYVYGGNTAIVTTPQTAADGSDVQRRHAYPGLLDAQDPDLVRT